MNENIIIKPTSFEDAKNHIQTFASKTSPSLGLDKVETSCGLFGVFDHKVTGDELNQVTTQIQDYLIKFNGLHADFIDEFGQVYKALESLDKEYIPAILGAIKGAEMASNQAKTAQEDIKKSIEAQKKIIKVLEVHKKELDKLKHLGSIDKIWESSRALEKDMGVFKNESEEMKKQISKLDDGLKALQKFDNEILDYEHLEDVDEMWGMITSVEEKLPDFSTKLENLEVNIATNTSSIENLESKVAILYEYEHLSDIDTIWSDVEFQKEKLSDLENAVNTHNQNIKDLELDTLLLKNFKDEVEKQEHIKQIDEIWRDVDAGKKSINSISEKVSYNEDTIQTVSISLDNEKKASQKLEDRVLKMESSTNLHKEKLEKIEQQEHLFDIDGLWNKEENSNSQINQLMGRLDVVTNSVEDLNNQLNVEKNVHESDVQLLHKKLKTAYYVGGGAVIFCVIEITLQLMRIL